MSQDTQHNTATPSRTILINPFYKKPKVEVLAGTTNIANPKIVSTSVHINPLFRKPKADFIHGAANIVNPKIISAGAHINPLFLTGNRPPSIHMNPKFLKRKLLLQQQLQNISDIRQAVLTAELLQSTLIPPNIVNPPQFPDKLIVNTNSEKSATQKETTQKLISKSRTKIVREPAATHKVNTIAVPPQPSAPLIRLSNRKLVRRTHLSPAMAARALSSNIAPAKSVNTVGKYKVDRRHNAPMVTPNKKHLSPALKFKRKTFVARYALQRSNSKSKTFPRSVERGSMSINKKIQMLNINGVLYRSTRNKLQRKDASSHTNQSRSIGISTIKIQSNSSKNASPKHKTTPNGRVLFVHGTKFVLDKSGYKLTRMASGYQNNTNSPQNKHDTPARQRRRIDIGGLTYIASTTSDVFVRTRNHLALAHLNMAKNRSLQFLTRRFVKTNIPCAIFQRIGKCRAHERGKCNKVHDKQQVTICPRFLRGSCHNPACLLSHNVSLAKMPVCRFYLQGVCVRNDCPYLHKKLSVNTDICPYFLRGYCKLAELCNKRHEFLCPEYERNGKCELFNCIYCKSRKRKYLSEQPKPQRAKVVKKITRSEVAVENDQENNATMRRYFIDNETDFDTSSKVQTEDIAQEADTAHEVEVSDSDHDVTSVQARPKVGALPAFIPLN